MENEIIKTLEKDAEDAVKKIKELEEQIKEYKTGAESFSAATKALEKNVESQEDLFLEFANFLKKLDSLETSKIVDSISDLSQNVYNLNQRIEKIETKIDKNILKTRRVKTEVAGLSEKINFVFKRKLRKINKS